MQEMSRAYPRSHLEGASHAPDGRDGAMPGRRNNTHGIRTRLARMARVHGSLSLQQRGIVQLVVDKREDPLCVGWFADRGLNSSSSRAAGGDSGAGVAYVCGTACAKRYRIRMHVPLSEFSTSKSVSWIEISLCSCGGYSVLYLYPARNKINASRRHTRPRSLPRRVSREQIGIIEWSLFGHIRSSADFCSDRPSYHPREGWPRP